MPKAKKKAATKVESKKVDVKSKVKSVDKEKFMEFAKSAGKILGLLLVLLLVDLFVQYLNNNHSVAIVNGERIPRSEYVETLERMYGAQIADAMIEEKLVQQLGESEGVEIDSDELDEAYEEIEDQLGGAEALESALEQNNMDASELREQLRSELVLKKIIQPRLEYTDEDLADFFDEYKELIYEDTDDLDFEEVREEIEEYYVDQKTFEERDTVLGEFQEESTIQMNVLGVGDEIGYRFFGATRNLVTNFLDERNRN